MMELPAGKTPGTQGPDTVSTKCEQVAQWARAHPNTPMTALAHLIDYEWLLEAFRRTRKDGATGVDRVTAEEYARHLESNLRDLLERFKAGTYEAPPVRRAYIPKRDGRRRALGIPTFEDKVLQRAVAMLLEPVYEQDFKDSSFGFRPRRSAHMAVNRLREGVMGLWGGHVLELDIASYFDTIPHAMLREVVHARIGDGVLRCIIGKWLRAGVMEDGIRQDTATGTPQGGVVSPLLANIYLHTVLDRWFEEEIRPRLSGEAFLVRYADDAVLVFAREEDARRVMEVLPKRFARFGLALHPVKTRLIRFTQPGARDRDRGDSESFDFLGFTHYWALSRRGSWVVKQKTAKDRLRSSVRDVTEWCRTYRHAPLAYQHEVLCRKLRGHYQYFGLTGNSAALGRFSRAVRRAWHKWLGRRSDQRFTWSDFKRLMVQHPLPEPRAVHSTLLRTASP